MGRHTKLQQPFLKIADVLPKGFDPDHVASFFAPESAAPGGHGATVASSHKHVVTDVMPSIETSVPDFSRAHEVHGSGHTEPAPQSSFQSVFDVYANDLDGFARSVSGGGKGKHATKTDPVVTDQTEPTTTPIKIVPTTDTTPTVSLPAADYVSGHDTPDGYNVELVFKGTWSDAAKAAAYTAAENISDIVTGDVPDYNGIDDIRITLTSTSIDGTGGTWGKGGYDILRSGSYLPSTGHVTIDSADVPNAIKLGLLDDLLEHEMMHAMGFGTTWNAMGLVDDHNGDLRFNGANATHVYNTVYASLAAQDPLHDKGVPIETDGGSGAAGKHWDETTFQKEIMTTTLNYTNTVSPLTVAALEDMGYHTTYADAFLFT